MAAADRTSPTLPVLTRVIRAINVVGGAVARAGLPVVPFDEGAILRSARRQTGLADFGGDEFREPLRQVVAGLDHEARLTLIGRIAARADATALATIRLRLEEDRKRHPEIGEQEITRPLFIVGLPRTGSTLLHHLLGQDPRHRVAQAWEVMFPSPPPERTTYGTDPRIARAAAQLRWLDRLAPGFRRIHPLGAQLALECIAIMSASFLSPRFHTTYRMPTYQAWLEHQDLGPAYAFHRRFLQQLQWRAPGDRWVLKAPSHMWSLDALFEVYPDALIVQTHRDPLAVIPSVASLTAVLQGAFAADVDPAEIGAEVTHRWTTGLARAVQFRARGRVPAERFFDLHYHDLLADPLASVRRIYAHFDIPFTAHAEARMRGHLAGSPQDRHGPHRYSLGAFGLDADTIARRFKDYREFFGVRSEYPDTLGA